MNFFDVAIVGGGASGCVCAIMLARKGKRVCILDAQETPAKKLLVTGNGRCNLTNFNVDSSFYNKNIDSFLSQFNHNNAIDFFSELGVKVYADEEGRCYPISNSAKSVVFALQYALNSLNVRYFANSNVVDIDRGEFFTIKTDNATVAATKIVLACGITEQNCELLSKLKVNYKKSVPSLVALKTAESTRRLDGLRLSGVKVTAKCLNATKVQNGEVLFKQDGLSGICIFNLSALFARQTDFNGTIEIDIFPHISHEDLFKTLKHNCKIYQTASEFLLPILHKEIALDILKRLNIDFDFPCKDISDARLKKTVYIIKNFSFNVVGCYNNNQVCCGGIDLSELSNGLQHKKQTGLYCAGEICDVDGECGGYNLQWAFTSAFVVAQDILKNKSN